jgi:hypothetical protein
MDLFIEMCSSLKALKAKRMEIFGNTTATRSNTTDNIQNNKTKIFKQTSGIMVNTKIPGPKLVETSRNIKILMPFSMGTTLDTKTTGPKQTDIIRSLRTLKFRPMEFL